MLPSNLRTPAEMAAYLDAWLEEASDDTAGIAKVLGNVARAKGMPQVAKDAGLGKRRLQIDRSGPFFTVFLAHSWAMGLQTRQKLPSLGPIFAFDAPSPTGSQALHWIGLLTVHAWFGLHGPDSIGRRMRVRAHAAPAAAVRWLLRFR